MRENVFEGDQRVRITWARFAWLAALLGINAAMLVSAPPLSAIPAWSRRYGAPCGLCHDYPSLQLTGQGLDFFRRGHRLKGDAFDKDFTHVLSAHIEWEYDVVEGFWGDAGESMQAYYQVQDFVRHHGVNQER